MRLYYWIVAILFAIFCASAPTPTESITPDFSEKFVLLDDFENRFRAQPGINHLGAAAQYALDTFFQKSGWYVFGNDSTAIFSLDSVKLLTWEQWYKKEISHNNAALAIGSYGVNKNGIGCKIYLKSNNDVYAYAGLGTSFAGEYYTNKVDLSDLDSISFMARGKGKWRLQIVTDTIDQGYPPEDQWGHFGMDFQPSDTWKIFNISIDNFKPMNYSRAKKEKLQWKTACVKSTFLEFITSQYYGQNVDDTLELQIDDIRLYGVTYDKTFGFRYKVPR